MKDVSALMDGELDRKRADATIERVEQQEELRDAWATFHVIRETLRGEPIRPGHFTERFHERLMQEQTVVVAPWARLPRAPLAAALAVLVLAGVLASLAVVEPPPAGRTAAPPGLAAFGPVVVGGVDARVYAEYLAAHRQFLPPAELAGMR
jgi:sigma-E factor negative regulatory protein RseA